ncbi:uncharacterized protein CLUP02_04385 [Colletotrichum lupini]|uniref:NmrA-like domain-containing protein n=1 Tax=Colletotrichum lupini TaxID=145971 RepID=A0A9Q8WD89_9PEZI|nr:uncharacterized protein CLUP02_04385 [Colletotrichum lupini]UQC78906.1 hypothetical protein CLUP02_04385 [Colletotrichum lupini]
MLHSSRIYNGRCSNFALCSNNSIYITEIQQGVFRIRISLAVTLLSPWALHAKQLPNNYHNDFACCNLGRRGRNVIAAKLLPTNHVSALREDLVKDAASADGQWRSMSEIESVRTGYSGGKDVSAGLVPFYPEIKFTQDREIVSCSAFKNQLSPYDCKRWHRFVLHLISAHFTDRNLGQRNGQHKPPNNVVNQYSCSVRPITDSGTQSLHQALTGQDAVLCVLGHTVSDRQVDVINATAKVGVKTFIPSDFGTPKGPNDVPENRAILREKAQARALLEEKAKEDDKFT